MNYDRYIIRLNEIIEERFSDGVINNSSDISTLLNARGHFTSLYAFLGEKEKTAYEKFKKAENARKTAYLRSKIGFMGAGDSASASEPKAELDVVELKDAEVIADVEYRAAKLDRETVKAHIDFLNQAISVVKQELGLSENQHLK